MGAEVKQPLHMPDLEVLHFG